MQKLVLPLACWFIDHGWPTGLSLRRSDSDQRLVISIDGHSRCKVVRRTACGAGECFKQAMPRQLEEHHSERQQASSRRDGEDSSYDGLRPRRTQLRVAMGPGMRSCILAPLACSERARAARMLVSPTTGRIGGSGRTTLSIGKSLGSLLTSHPTMPCGRATRTFSSNAWGGVASASSPIRCTTSAFELSASARSSPTASQTRETIPEKLANPTKRTVLHHAADEPPTAKVAKPFDRVSVKQTGKGGGAGRLDRGAGGGS